MKEKILDRTTRKLHPSMEIDRAGSDHCRSSKDRASTDSDCPVVERKKREGAAPGFNKFRLVLGLLITAFAAIFILKFMVRPLENKLMEARTRIAAQSLIHEVKIRAAVMDSAGKRYSEGQLISLNNLEKAASIIKSRFRDFLTLEVINSRGRIVIMVGELSEPGPALDSRTQVAKFRILETQYGAQGQIFNDYPENNYFTVTIREITNKGAFWYLRGRFSRRAIEKALNGPGASDLITTELLPIKGHVTGLRSSGELQDQPKIRVKGSLLSGSNQAEAMIFANKWIMTSSKKSLMYAGPIGLVIILCLLALYHYLFPARTRQGSIASAPSEPNLVGLKEPYRAEEAMDITWKGLSEKPGRRFRFEDDPDPKPEPLENLNQGPEYESPHTSESLVEIETGDLELFSEMEQTPNFSYLADDSREKGSEKSSVSPEFLPHKNPEIWAEPDPEGLEDRAGLPSDQILEPITGEQERDETNMGQDLTDQMAAKWRVTSEY